MDEPWPATAIARVRMLESALRDSEGRLQVLVDAVTQYAIFTLDPDGVITSWNSGAERMKGYTPDEVVGHHFSMLHPAESRDARIPERLLAQARADGNTRATGWRLKKDGSQFWADVLISAVVDDEGNHTGFIKVVQDLTEQHDLEAVQDTFYNAFEHDFKLPLTAIKGFAELIPAATAETCEHFAIRIAANVDRLLSMAEDVVAYARHRSGPVPLTLQSVDMVSLAQLAVANLGSVEEIDRVRFSGEASVHVLADPAALERVVANLVTNALSYSPAGSGVTIACGRVESLGALKVIDHGRGVDERDLRVIFEEFERGRLAQDDSGTGIGLASVREMVELQAGTIDIASRVGVGTTVTVQLPIAAPTPPP